MPHPVSAPSADAKRNKNPKRTKRIGRGKKNGLRGGWKKAEEIPSLRFFVFLPPARPPSLLASAIKALTLLTSSFLWPPSSVARLRSPSASNSSSFIETNRLEVTPGRARRWLGVLASAQSEGFSFAWETRRVFIYCNGTQFSGWLGALAPAESLRVAFSQPRRCTTATAPRYPPSAAPPLTVVAFHGGYCLFHIESGRSLWQRGAGRAQITKGAGHQLKTSNAVSVPIPGLSTLLVLVKYVLIPQPWQELYSIYVCRWHIC